MISKTQILDALLGKQILDALLETLDIQDDDFPEIHQAYLAAMDTLKTVLDPDIKHSVQKYVTAIEQQCASNLFFAGVQGLKMNLEHFKNPMTPNCTWPQVDYDDYLRVDLAYTMPLYEAAEKYIKQFEKNLSVELRDACDAIICYKTALEVNGMKLAHFYGYLIGNDLLKNCVPGYQSDHVLDFRYRHMLEQYFGGTLRMDQWEGCSPVKDWNHAPVQEADPQTTYLL